MGYEMADDDDRRFIADLDADEAQRQVAGVLPEPLGETAADVWVLSRTQIFAQVPAADLQRLAADAVRVELPGREAVLLCEAGQVYLLESGGVKLVAEAEHGRRLIEDVVNPGGFFGELSPCPPEHAHAAEALEQSALLRLPQQAVRSLLAERPDIALSVVQVLEDRQRKLSRRLQSLVFKSVEARVVETILEMTKEYPDRCEHGLALDIRLSQQDLADLVGTSRESVNRTLRHMQKRYYVIRHGRTLCVPSLSRLERLAKVYS